jgi:hypothetical protein
VLQQHVGFIKVDNYQGLAFRFGKLQEQVVERGHTHHFIRQTPREARGKALIRILELCLSYHAMAAETDPVLPTCVNTSFDHWIKRCFFVGTPSHRQWPVGAEASTARVNAYRH